MNPSCRAGPGYRQIWDGNESGSANNPLGFRYGEWIEQALTPGGQACRSKRRARHWAGCSRDRRSSVANARGNIVGTIWSDSRMGPWASSGNALDAQLDEIIAKALDEIFGPEPAV
jgi:hypothetical protein